MTTADEKKLAAIYTPEEINAFYERRQNHIKGESKSYTVEEAHDLIRKNRKYRSSLKPYGHIAQEK